MEETANRQTMAKIWKHRIQSSTEAKERVETMCKDYEEGRQFVQVQMQRVANWHDEQAEKLREKAKNFFGKQRRSQT